MCFYDLDWLPRVLYKFVLISSFFCVSSWGDFPSWISFFFRRFGSHCCCHCAVQHDHCGVEKVRFSFVGTLLVGDRDWFREGLSFWIPILGRQQCPVSVRLISLEEEIGELYVGSSFDVDNGSGCECMMRFGLSVAEMIGSVGLSRVLGRLDFEIFGGCGLGLLRYESLFLILIGPMRLFPIRC